MAIGDVTIFDDAIEYLLKGSPDCPFDFGATPDLMFMAIVNNATVPATTTPDPCWGAGGTTNFATNEQSGGSMTVGGLACASVVVSIVGGVPQIDMDDPITWATNASNPTTCYHAILYSNTATNKNCLAAIDLGGVFDATTGPLTITLGAPFITADS